MKNLLISFLTISVYISPTYSVTADENTVNTLMKSYQLKGVKSADAQRGEQFWSKTFTGNEPFTERSCKSCHTANLKTKGEHVRTGKIIKPLAPSVNQASLSDVKKVNKWFKRNCKWTTGKECSAQVKADILAFIKQQ
ncbi:MAG: DUF1924 domain-containing protein [Gammaproteobacteria bacterium]|nr:DUF1924 domain-containing protein [Gammaproteobacteria bacterium]MDH5659632.1 DUF1924 domain-containing protein [Gammaproteobacteria bacterium]